MGRIWLVSGALLAFLGVAGGAFGAHALKERLTPELLQIFEVGVRYQMYHALGLLLVGLAAAQQPRTGWNVAGWGFLIGVVVFSGSLYALALSGVKAWGAVTPFGGVAFLVGWLAALVAVLRGPRAV